MDFVTELIEAVYTETVAKKTVMIYPGRFQPPSPHHFAVYTALVGQFSIENVYIASTNVVSADSPLNFLEKKAVWMKYGVPANQIVQVKSPYQCTEIIETLPTDTTVVFGFGEKDKGRFTIGKKKDGTPSYLQDYDLEMRRHNLKDFTKHSYIMTLPHVSAKVGGVELSGTQIRNMIASDPSKEMFQKIFGWYDPKIHELLVKKFSKQPLNEGGHMFDKSVSYVKKENLDSTIENTLEMYSLESIPYSKIGNFQKPVLGDIDIAVDSEDLAKFLKTGSSKEEIFAGLKKYFDLVGAPKSYVLSTGLNQIHLLGLATTPNGEDQEYIGNKEKEDSRPLIQLDIMLGNRKWREKLYSGSPNSEYKAKYRNLFIMEIFSKLIEDEGSIEGVKQKYLLSPGEGFFLQKFTLSPTGKKKEISRELKSTDMDFVAKFLFGEDKSFSDIDTFEKVYALFKSDDFKFPQLRQEVLTAYRESIQKHTDSTNPKLNERKSSIQRFSGVNEMSDGNFLQFLEKIHPLVQSGKLDLSVKDSVSITEKLDAAGCQFGLNSSGVFYLQSSNSGEVTAAQSERFNNTFTSHFYAALNFLNSYQPFQKSLKTVFDRFGQFKVSSEMFAVLVHQGDQFGDVVFATTKYSKSKLGEKGAFVCFGAVNQDGDKFSKEILSIISSPHDKEWRVYDLAQHGNLSREGLVFNLSGLNDLIENPEKLKKAEALLRTRKESPEKDALKKAIQGIRAQLQDTLNQYAEKINSFLSNGSGKYPVEGVVLKIELPDEDIFIKGTSNMFNQVKEKTWGTRSALGDIESVFDGEFLKNILGLKTSHAATINQAIAAARQKVGAGTDDETLSRVALEVYHSLRATGDIPDSNVIREKAKEALTKAANEINATISKWNQVKPTVDPDTARKTDEQLKYVADRFKRLSDAIVSTKYQGEAYAVYLLLFLLDKKIKGSHDNT